MFPQLISESAVIADMQERRQQSQSESEWVESYRWFHKTKTNKPMWLRNALWHFGHLLVVIGHQLEDGAVNLTSAPPRQVKSM